MRKNVPFYVCSALLIGLWTAQQAFERWSDARSRSSSIPLQGPLDDVPFVIGQWFGRTAQLDPQIIQVAGADQFIHRTYHDREGRAVSLYITYYGGLYRFIPHGPATCYPMGGWKALEAETVTDDEGKPVCHLLLFEKELDKHLVLYWYYVNGVRLAGASRTRLGFAARLLRGGGGSIVQVQLTAAVGGTKAQVLRTLTDFRAQLEPVLKEFLPVPHSRMMPTHTSGAAECHEQQERRVWKHDR